MKSAACFAAVGPRSPRRTRALPRCRCPQRTWAACCSGWTAWNRASRSARCRARMCTHPTSCWPRAAWRLSSWWRRTRPRPSLANKKEPMRFSEMRPAPDELWLMDDRGRYCAEFRTSCAGKLGRLLRPYRKPAAWQAQQDKESSLSNTPSVEPVQAAIAERSSLNLRLARVRLPFALAHFVSYFFRTVNAVVYPDLAHDLGLAADSIGLLTGAYFFAFAAAQLPVGVALDRFGPRKVQVPMLMIATVGAALFSYAHSLTELIIARGLIGFGVAGSLMAAIKASSLWLPQERLPLSTAVLLSVSGMGAMASTAPMHAILQHTDWRGAFLGLGFWTLGVSLLILAVVPEPPKKQETRFLEMATAVKQVYSLWSFWRLGLYSIFAHATYMAVQGLWMGPWLRDVAHRERTAVANVLLAGTVARAAG